MARLLLTLIAEMTKELRCADVFEGCAHVEQGNDIRELITRFMVHVRETHRVMIPTPALRIQAMTAVKEVLAHIE